MTTLKPQKLRSFAERPTDPYERLISYLEDFLEREKMNSNYYRDRFWETLNNLFKAQKIINTLKTENSELKHQIDKLQLENKLIKKYKK